MPFLSHRGAESTTLSRVETLASRCLARAKVDVTAVRVWESSPGEGTSHRVASDSVVLAALRNVTKEDAEAVVENGPSRDARGVNGVRYSNKMNDVRARRMFCEERC